MPKIIAGSCFGAKTVKMADKPQKKGKEMLKRLVKKRKGKFQKLGEYYARMGGWKYLPKVEGFLPKWEGWNLWHFSEGDIVHAAQDQDSWR